MANNNNPKNPCADDISEPYGQAIRPQAVYPQYAYEITQEEYRAILLRRRQIAHWTDANGQPQAMCCSCDLCRGGGQS